MGNIKGKSIRLFMVDGTPQGLLTLEIVNWTGHLLSGPRARITELISRPEMKKSGIYFLVGADPEGSLKPYVYIGESDVVGDRLKTHNIGQTKDFWDRVYVITSKDPNLTKAHVRYLESRIISIASQAGRARLFNKTAPHNENLPEADIADMDYFIEQIRLILPVLGLDFLREQIRVTNVSGQNAPSVNESLSEDPVFEIHSKKHGIRAQAKEIDGEFIVLAGSDAQSEWIGQGSADSSYGRLHALLYQEQKIKNDPAKKTGTFQEDVTFNSPSAASSVIYGHPSNGRTSWKIKDTAKTYEDWQNERLGKVSVLGLDDLRDSGSLYSPEGLSVFY